MVFLSFKVVHLTKIFKNSLLRKSFFFNPAYWIHNKFIQNRQKKIHQIEKSQSNLEKKIIRRIGPRIPGHWVVSGQFCSSRITPDHDHHCHIVSFHSRVSSVAASAPLKINSRQRIKNPALILRAAPASHAAGIKKLSLITGKIGLGYKSTSISARKASRGCATEARVTFLVWDDPPFFFFVLWF